MHETNKHKSGGFYKAHSVVRFMFELFEVLLLFETSDFYTSISVICI
jgi:hypothetical protein